MPLVALCLALIAPPDPAPIVLARRFTLGEKLAYNVTSHITAEQREKGLETFIPEDLDIDYGFNYVVEALNADGIATVRFQQPSTTETQGETGDSAPKAKVEKSDKIYRMTLSPINEVIDTKDVTPPKPGKKKPTTEARWTMPSAPRQAPIFGDYIAEMHRLALFVGSLDFSPSLPVDMKPVKVGDTWKRTASYQPQKLKGTKKAAVQRLDYTYAYLGPMTVEGKKILRIEAKLDLNTDLADYLNTLIEGSGLQTNLKTMPLHMKATIDYDLDPQTRTTLSASAKSEGGFELFVKEDPEAYYEERFKGRTNLDLVGRKVVPLGK